MSRKELLEPNCNFLKLESNLIVGGASIASTSIGRIGVVLKTFKIFLRAKF